jgi:hypothetical protein
VVQRPRQCGRLYQTLSGSSSLATPWRFAPPADSPCKVMSAMRLSLCHILHIDGYCAVDHLSGIQLNVLCFTVTAVHALPQPCMHRVYCACTLHLHSTEHSMTCKERPTSDLRTASLPKSRNWQCQLGSMEPGYALHCTPCLASRSTGDGSQRLFEVYGCGLHVPLGL